MLRVRGACARQNRLPYGGVLSRKGICRKTRVHRAAYHAFHVGRGAENGVWRFLIEYARADDRGETIVSFLSPSQLIAAVLLIAAVVVFFIEHRYGGAALQGNVQSDERENGARGTEKNEETKE